MQYLQIQLGAIWFWISNSDSDACKKLIKQEKLQNLEPSENPDEISPLHRHYCTRPFLSVVRDVAESAEAPLTSMQLSLFAAPSFLASVGHHTHNIFFNLQKTMRPLRSGQVRNATTWPVKL